MKSKGKSTGRKYTTSKKLGYDQKTDYGKYWLEK